MIYDTNCPKYQWFMAIQCEICYERKQPPMLMPPKTSCSCTGHICAECFYQDFNTRKRLYALTPDGDYQNVDKCESPDLDDVHQFVDFQMSAFGNNLEFYSGRTCPFCNVLQFWKLHEHPQVLPSTGNMTFYAPTINWNAET